MPNQQLTLNVLTFSHLVETAKFVFSIEKRDDYFPICKTDWPCDIDSLFPDLPENTEFLYVNYPSIPEDIRFNVNLHAHPGFALHYYNWLIDKYFKGIACISKSPFITDNEFWFFNKQASSGQFYIFKRFVLNVQINHFSGFPELIISYEGDSEVIKKPLNKLNIPTEAIQQVIFNRMLYPYNNLPAEAKHDLNKVYPVYTQSICSAMGLKWTPYKPPNKLKFYYQEISWFITKYLNIPGFKKIIPINSFDLIKVPEERIFSIPNECKQLIFGKNKTDLKPYNGLIKNGPFNPTPHNYIEFILIMHDKDRATAEKLISWFNGEENSSSGSLKDFIKMNYYLNINKSIIFHDAQNPVPEIRKQLEEWPFKEKTKYLGVYISPHNKENPDKNIQNIKNQVEFLLLHLNVTSQVIESDIINNSSFKYRLPDFAVSILAKLNGIPWSAKLAISNNIIIGLGVFKSKNLSNYFIGSSFCFSQDGFFRNFYCNTSNTILSLSGKIRTTVQRIADKCNNPDRLVIHFYHKLSRQDLESINNALTNLNLKIPLIIININKTESCDLVLFDKACPSDNMLPNSGTYVAIGHNQFLLCNNARYGDKMPGAIEGFPFPIKLNIQSTDEKQLENKPLINDLIKQVYQFSRINWSSFTQQILPVTVKYPEILAEKFEHFEGENFPAFGKENLWFL